ncbi:actin-1-like [Myotis myotis]|uniref:actin-1-like n=1 Tax=Myotis myotis TaxID=51298 RepID=UPI00174E5173|nr:actin-1-like [Myotis myotis]
MSWCKTGNCLTIRSSALAAVLRARALLGPQDAMSVPIICDFGSGSSKVGFAGAKVPLAIFPTVLGKFRHLEDVSDSRRPAWVLGDLMVGLDKKVWFIGDEVQEQRKKLNLVYPLSRATVTNWDHMEKIWHHTFYQVLRAAPEQHPLLLTEPPSNPKASKERTAQILFETFNVPALYLVNQGVLSLFSSGLTSGVKPLTQGLALDLEWDL